MKTVVITGGAGFLGSHIADRYLTEEWRVIVLDNLLTGQIVNLAGHQSNPSLQFIEHDVTEPFLDRVEAVCVSSPELLLHFASPASPVEYGRFPIETMRVNSLGTQNAADAARIWGARLLYASTSEAYGDPVEHPQTEGYWGNVNPVGVRSCYDESKRYGEALISTYVREHGLDAIIIRIFNTYGPRMGLDDGRVVPNFIKQALLGQPLTVYGDGLQTRSFCYVDDLVEGVIRSALRSDAHGPVNLGNPREERISDFARIICEIAGVPLLVENRPLPPDDPTRRCPDISLARSLLGWEPQVTLERGLALTIQHFEKVIRSSRYEEAPPTQVESAARTHGPSFR